MPRGFPTPVLAQGGETGLPLLGPGPSLWVCVMGAVVQGPALEQLRDAALERAPLHDLSTFRTRPSQNLASGLSWISVSRTLLSITIKK